MPSLFDRIELGPLSEKETQWFFNNAFESAGHPIDKSALELLSLYSGGHPMLMHEIGEATFWIDEDYRIDCSDAKKGILGGAERIGGKYLRPQVLEVIHSEAYLSFLDMISQGEVGTPIHRKDIIEKLTAGDKKKFDAFLGKMKKLGVLVGDVKRGDYHFARNLYHLYFKIESRRDDRTVTDQTTLPFEFER